MDHPYTGVGGGGWPMIPNIPTHTNTPTPANHDPLYLHQQQQHHHFHQQQQQQFEQQQQQQRLHPQQQQQLHHHQSLVSHFHPLHLVENLADVVENGNRDQHSDALVNELNNHFEKCQQMLKSISDSISTKAMTVEQQKRKLEESERLLDQRRDLIGNYRDSVEELIKSEP
ncbi:Mediator of RNA polymerase II transcription subunit 9 [Dillenia turbinata]|uniref:Mediator of RNA polymerase II transcription subunit 9 n=1 Tax=Dillenia turbinata TaxID=194707 RepID=A0AAN8VNL7_9MAGN